MKLVTEQRYSVAEAAQNPGLHENLLRTWKKKAGAEANDSDLSDDERMELVWLRAGNKRLWRERDL